MTALDSVGVGLNLTGEGLKATLAGQRVGYVRVSTLDQNEKRQLEGQVLDRIFTDKVSGRDTARPQLTELLRFAQEGDTVVVHIMDRLARNLVGLRALVRASHAPHGQPHALRHGGLR